MEFYSRQPQFLDFFDVVIDADKVKLACWKSKNGLSQQVLSSNSLNGYICRLNGAQKIRHDPRKILSRAALVESFAKSRSLGNMTRRREPRVSCLHQIPLDFRDVLCNS